MLSSILYPTDLSQDPVGRIYVGPNCETFLVGDAVFMDGNGTKYYYIHNRDGTYRFNAKGGRLAYSVEQMNARL